MECDRCSVKNNVLSLKGMGYDIAMDKGYRLLSREFDDSELRILTDSVLFSKSISTKQTKGMIDEKMKPMRQIPEVAKGLNLPKHMAEHFYMFSGESVAVWFLCGSA